ncbi:probable G-protein coupled receptor 139 [Narcine bancroftii]|uniref:probable G-protein coupled receptor 139 n=1 Tax=Narcine bancroftii TaxID=1343680 RepID=UPI003831B385
MGDTDVHLHNSETLNVSLIEFVVEESDGGEGPAVPEPANLLVIVVLNRRKCGLSRCVTCYMVAMAVADLLVVIFDLLLMHVPIVFASELHFILQLPVCNLHSAMIHAAVDASVWFTVAFSFDRCVAICYQRLRTRYCTEKTAAAVLGTLAALVSLKDISWYFMYTPTYRLTKNFGFCAVETHVSKSVAWGTTELLHYVFTPCVPFLLVLLFNTFTIRNILAASAARRRLRGSAKGCKDAELENRRKSIIMLFVISGNFIVLWAMFTVSVIQQRLFWLGYQISFHVIMQEVGYMLQLLSCCTNTIIYVMLQSKFRENLKHRIKCPFSAID